MRIAARSSLVGVTAVAMLATAGAVLASAAERIAAVAVFPVENLSGGGVPAEEVRQFLASRLSSEGIRVLGNRQLDEFMARHRVRYAAGIDTQTAEALAREAHVDAVVITTVELSSEAVPPKVALNARLVSVKGAPVVLWAEDAGLAGDDAPGLLALGVVNDYQKLLAKALTRIAGSLVSYVTTGAVTEHRTSASKFRPKMVYRQLTLEPGTTYSVAVMPFFNLSDRRNAGEILAVLFMRHLSEVARFRVIDTGVVREQLLNARIIMDGGLSITDADTVAALTDADFVLGGRVLRYQDYEGPAGEAKVEFTTVLMERKRGRVVWSSDSYNEGTDGVHFFERGTTRTAHAMATQMVRITTDMIAGRAQ